MSTLKAIRWPVLALIGGIAFVYAVNSVLFTARGFKVTATFKDASGLVPKSAVRIAGADAGTVSAIKVNAHDQAVVTMRLSHGAKGVGTGAKAFIRSVNLLGEKYVDLSPGDLTHPLKSGATIPLARTGHTVDLDQVLGVLDPDTRMRLSVLINESGIALMGRGQDFNALLRQLPPSLDQARQLVAGLGQDNATLAKLIEQGDQVLAPIGNRTPDLEKLVTNVAGTLQAVADRRQKLGSTLQDAPATLRQARSTLDELKDAAGQLKPAAVDLRATAPAISDTLSALPAFTGDAVPALSSVTANAPRLTKLAKGALPTVTRLRPTAQNLSTFAGRLKPVVDNLDGGGAWKNLLNFFWGWARTTRDADGLSHIFGLRIVLDESAVRSDIDRLLAGQSTAAARKNGDEKPLLPDPKSGADAKGGTTASAGAGPKSLLPDHLKLPGVPSVTLPPVDLPQVKLPPTADQGGADATKKALDFLLGK